MINYTTIKMRKIIGIVLGLILVAWTSYFVRDIAVGFWMDALAIIRSLIYTGLLIAWCYSIYVRILNRKQRKFLFLTGVLLLFWETIKTMKWHFFPEFSFEGRYCWYLYYIPMILIPLLGFYFLDCLDKSEEHSIALLKKLMLIPAVLMIGIVLTNDLHFGVFRFPEGIKYYSSIYTYGPIYFVIMAWIYGLGIYFVIRLLYQNWSMHMGLKQLMPLWIILLDICLAIVYAAGIIRHTDIVIISCFAIIALIESSIWSGLIMANSGYDELFRISMNKIWITDQDFHIKFASENEDVPGENQMRDAVGKVIITEDEQLNHHYLTGGHVFWKTDISRIRRVLNSLEAAERQLNENKDILQAEIELQEQEAHIREQNQIYERIAVQTGPQMVQIQNLQKRWKQDPAFAAEALKQMCVWGSYLKRFSNLILLQQKREWMELKELELAIRECAGNLSFSDKKVNLSFAGENEIKSAYAVMLFQMFFAVIEKTFDHSSAYEILFVEDMETQTLQIWADVQGIQEVVLRSMNEIADAASDLSVVCKGTECRNGTEFRITVMHSVRAPESREVQV